MIYKLTTFTTLKLFFGVGHCLIKTYSRFLLNIERNIIEERRNRIQTRNYEREGPVRDDVITQRNGLGVGVSVKWKWYDD
ncbi:hypothetical protein [Brevibacillus daliensis]|uniref:hypothetical protein n=1 Tax=Brevibacillus daliensis TaxID=2892995 RepID=UPI001E28B4C5|nr:hypothetical protein [Brevibacillus daliensis]